MTKDHERPTEEPTVLEQEAYSWVVRFVSGEAGPRDVEALKEWAARSPAHAAAFDQTSALWRTLGRAGPAPFGMRTSSIQPARATTSLRPSPIAASRIGRRHVLGGALAASAVGATVMALHPPFGLWPSWTALAAHYRTGTGEQRQIMLAGRVSIDMNTRTSIALDAADRDAAGIELFAGEAMVATAPHMARPFTVAAAGGRVIAADARFNVRHDGQPVRVACLFGEVRVECGQAALSLPAGRQVSYSERGMGPVTGINSQVITAWKDGFVIFEATPITEVVDEINRYRPGRIILTNATLGRERFSARFRIERIEQVVGQIAQVFGVQARSLPGGFVLLG